MVVKDVCPTARAYTLSEYAGYSADISDPFGGDLAVYRTCAAQIKKLLGSCLYKLKEDLWKE
jgi:methyl coenzyme M reductase alpha subunit